MFRVLIASFCLATGLASAQSFQTEVAPFIEATCIRCHDAETQTPLDMTKLGHDLADRDTFKTWVRIYERVKNREMPPRSEPRPKRAQLEKALASMKVSLVDANLAARGPQRTALRRLTRLEYGYTIQDLLHIDEGFAVELSQMLPAEADSGGYDTVAANQSMSSLHVRSYLKAANRALDAAIQLGPESRTSIFKADYIESTYVPKLANFDALGGGGVKKLDDAWVQFIEGGGSSVFHSESEGYEVPRPGRYRVSFEAYPYKATTLVGFGIYKGQMGSATASLSELIRAIDLEEDELRSFEATLFMQPGDVVAPDVYSIASRPPFKESGAWDGQNFEGEGVAFKSITIEGPLFDQWPPLSTSELLVGVEMDEGGEVRLTKDPYRHIVEIVSAFAPRAFRRPLKDGEAEAYASLAKPLLEDGRPFIEAVRISLRAILSAPAFLYHTGDSERLDNFALATRLSYFLWRSMPDDELLKAAAEGLLTDPDVLDAHVDRMLNDPKSKRFVDDFAGQAFRLYELNATSPDPGLYPEYDDLLGHAIRQETEMFLAELIAEDHGVAQLIDSDFTFVNRTLAEHYGIEGVEGQHMRKVTLPEDSPRGGLLTHASILKITANGTTTSPIRRGNFVLANLLGQPAPPPPADVDALEPDTRGTTTIREQLDAHRTDPVCASCHMTIDPPGFALESFDPIGGFRTHYRVAGGMTKYADFDVPLPPKKGPPVDASGVTSDGIAFSGIEDYKQILLDEELDQVARHLASELLTFSTGAEIEFADRDAVEAIVAAGRDTGHPIRTMIHEVVKSDLFSRQ